MVVSIKNGYNQFSEITNCLTDCEKLNYATERPTTLVFRNSSPIEDQQNSRLRQEPHAN